MAFATIIRSPKSRETRVREGGEPEPTKAPEKAKSGRGSREGGRGAEGRRRQERGGRDGEKDQGGRAKAGGAGRGGVRDRRPRLAEAPRARTVVGKAVVLALELDGLLAAQDPAHDLDVLPRACERLAEGLAVPAFDHLRTGDPQSAREADRKGTRLNSRH